MNPLLFGLVTTFVVVGLLLAYRFVCAVEKLADSAAKITPAIEKMTEVAGTNFAGAFSGVAEHLEEAGKAMTGLQMAAQEFTNYDRRRSGG